MSSTAFLKNLPDFGAIDSEKMADILRNLLTDNRRQLAELLLQKNYTWGNLMQPIEEMHDKLAKTWAPFAHLHAVMETEVLRKVYNACLPLLTEYYTEVAQNSQLYAAVKNVMDSSGYQKLQPAQQKILANEIRDFKLAGVFLPEKEKKQFAELQQKLHQTETQFSENVLDATQAFMVHITDERQIQGLPSQAKKLAEDHAKSRNLSGWVLALDYPSYSSAMMFLADRGLRQKLYEAYATRASDCGPDAGRWDNTPVMEAILKTRHEIAQLVGFSHYAEYSLATKMAKKSGDVLHFLQELLKKSKAMAQKEMQEVVDFAHSLDGLTSLAAWDVAYYSEKLREKKFHFSEEDLRPYFPLPKVIEGMFSLMQQLYGLHITEEKSVKGWHPNVQFFVIHDEKGDCRGGFYIDLYARAHKRDGAWMDEYCVRRRSATGEIQYPVAFLTCNFMPPLNGAPALLTHDEVLTLFHEFGHGLHHMLTQVEYAGVSGLHGVPWDAVEFPSQFMENWCWEKAVLDLIAEHYQTKEKLPEALYKKLLAAKYFHAGMQMVRQLEFALFDFRLHEEFDIAKPQQIQHILDDVRKETALISVAVWNRFQHSFSHIFAGGYAAGYYSYKWAEVLSSDAFAKFEESGLFDKKTGRAFLENVLEVGGVRDPMVAFVAFRGREPTVDALLKQYNLM